MFIFPGLVEPYRSEEDMATTWGHKAFVSSGPKRSPAPTSPVAKPQTSQPQEPPKERKRLVLAPRTVKTEDSEGASASTPQSDKPSKVRLLLLSREPQYAQDYF